MTDAFGNREGTARSTPREESARGPLRLDLVLLALFCVLALGGTAVGLVRAERDALDDPVQKGERGEVVGAEGLSLAAPANFAHALAVARTKLAPDHQLTSLRLAATRLNIIVRNTTGEQRSIQVGLDYKARVSDAGTNSATGPRNLAGIDTAAPARALTATLARERWAPSTFDYAVYVAPDGDTPSRWNLFFTKVPIERNHVAADGAGRLLPS
jgi:hypothetical protein